mgnify:CR=1 FL=1
MTGKKRPQLERELNDVLHEEVESSAEQPDIEDMNDKDLRALCKKNGI